MKQRVVFFGSGEYTIPIVKKLIGRGLDLIVTTEKNPRSPFLKFCSENNLRTISVSSVHDLVNCQSSIVNCSVAVLASFGAFIPDEIINSFPEGIINIHPSLLPKWKGPSPVQYSLLNGDTTTGVTLIKLDDQIDHGPILSQKPYQLQGNETTQDLLSILFEIGADMVVEQIDKLEKGEKLTETPQDHSKETWSYKISKQDGLIDISNLPSPISHLQNMIRAFHPWPGVWLRISSHVIASSETTKQSMLENKIVKLLPDGMIQVEGKRPMSYKDFINGYNEEGRELLAKLNLL